MGIYMKEALQNIDTLRKAALSQKEAYDKGESKEQPKVAPETFDMMEKMVRNISGDFSKGRTSIRETITSTDTVSLIPRVIEGAFYNTRNQ